VTRHHLYPQKYGRKKGHKAHAKAFPVVNLHKICHRMIHALFSEKYLVEHLNTVEAFRAHPEIQSFLEFIEDNPELRCASAASAKKQGKAAKRSARNIAVTGYTDRLQMGVAITSLPLYISIQLIA
jgi:hypothetical protein